MEWHLNDLSLHGQFASPQDFRTALEPILKARANAAAVAAKLFTSREFSFRPATPDMNLREAVLAIRDQNFVRQTLSWLDRAGPFGDDDRVHLPEDCFEHDGSDVTNLGLGEAARRHLAFRATSVFSLISERFQYSPLKVDYALPEEPLGVILITNSWHIEDLLGSTNNMPSSWSALLQYSSQEFTNLVFSDDILSQLAPFPCNPVIVERALELFEVLQSLATETNADGSLTPHGHELHQVYFQGHAPKFTDESDSNKRDFKSDLTFKDPSDPGKNIFCPWHGKIKQQQFRIHFEWPRPAGQTQIKLLYFADKITKH